MPEEAEARAAGVPEDAARIQQANYEEHLALLGECRPRDRCDCRAHDGKLDLYKKSRRRWPRTPSSPQHSACPITHLPTCWPEEIRRASGHPFFTPPPNRALV